MFEFLLIIFGFVIGFSLIFCIMHLYFEKIINALASLEEKYTFLIKIISEWQKKI